VKPPVNSAAPRSSFVRAGILVVAWSIAVAAAHPLGVWPAIGGAAVLLGGLAVRFDATLLRLLRPSPRRLAIGVIAGLLMGAATLLAYAPLADSSARVAAEAARLYEGFRGMPVTLATIVLVPVVLGEELVWRGAVQSALARRLTPTAAVLGAAVLYASAQAPLGSPVLVLVALACGTAWGALRAATNSLAPAFLAHLVWDVMVLLWRPLVS
jgi:membrane protease YdiL (CAAX protease family)